MLLLVVFFFCADATHWLIAPSNCVELDDILLESWLQHRLHTHPHKVCVKNGASSNALILIGFVRSDYRIWFDNFSHLYRAVSIYSFSRFFFLSSWVCFCKFLELFSFYGCFFIFSPSSIRLQSIFSTSFHTDRRTFVNSIRF